MRERRAGGPGGLDTLFSGLLGVWGARQQGGASRKRLSTGDKTAEGRGKEKVAKIKSEQSIITETRNITDLIKAANDAKKSLIVLIVLGNCCTLEVWGSSNKSDPMKSS